MNMSIFKGMNANTRMNAISKEEEFALADAICNDYKRKQEENERKRKEERERKLANGEIIKVGDKYYDARYYKG